MPTNEERLEEIKKTTQRITENLESDTSDGDVGSGQGASTQSNNSKPLKPGTEEYRQRAQELTDKIRSLAEKRDDISLDNIKMTDDGIIDASSIDQISREGGSVDIRDMEIPEPERVDGFEEKIRNIESDLSASGIQELTQMQAENISERERQTREAMEEVSGIEFEAGTQPEQALLRIAREGGPEMDREETLEREREEQKIYQRQRDLEKQRNRVASKQGQYEQLKAEEQNRLQQVRESKAPLENIQVESNRIQTEYERKKANLSSELSAEAAILQAQQNNLDTANTLVKESVDAAMYDFEQELQRWNQFLSVNSKVIEGLSSEKQQLLRDQKDRLQREYELRREEKLTKMQYRVEAANNGLDLGLTNSEIEEMELGEFVNTYSQKMQEMQAAEEVEEGALASYDPGVQVEAERLIQDAENIENAYQMVDSQYEGSDRFTMLGAVKAAWKENYGDITIELNGEEVGLDEADQYEVLENVLEKYGQNPEGFTFSFEESLLLRNNISSLPLEEEERKETFIDAIDRTMKNKESMNFVELENLANLYKASGANNSYVYNRIKGSGLKNKPEYLKYLGVQWGDKDIVRENSSGKEQEELIRAIEQRGYRQTREDFFEEPDSLWKQYTPLGALDSLGRVKTLFKGGLQGGRNLWRQIWE